MPSSFWLPTLGKSLLLFTLSMPLYTSLKSPLSLCGSRVKRSNLLPAQTLQSRTNLRWSPLNPFQISDILPTAGWSELDTVLQIWRDQRLVQLQYDLLTPALGVLTNEGKRANWLLRYSVQLCSNFKELCYCTPGVLCSTILARVLSFTV